jgi:hypothetical protein
VNLRAIPNPAASSASCYPIFRYSSTFQNSPQPATLYQDTPPALAVSNGERPPRFPKAQSRHTFNKPSTTYTTSRPCSKLPRAPRNRLTSSPTNAQLQRMQAHTEFQDTKSLNKSRTYARKLGHVASELIHQILHRNSLPVSLRFRKPIPTKPQTNSTPLPPRSLPHLTTTPKLAHPSQTWRESHATGARAKHKPPRAYLPHLTHLRNELPSALSATRRLHDSPRTTTAPVTTRLPPQTTQMRPNLQRAPSTNHPPQHQLSNPEPHTSNQHKNAPSAIPSQAKLHPFLHYLEFQHKDAQGKRHTPCDCQAQYQKTNMSTHYCKERREIRWKETPAANLDNNTRKAERTSPKESRKTLTALKPPVENSNQNRREEAQQQQQQNRAGRAC